MKTSIFSASDADFAELTGLWEASVRATHDFLGEEDLLAIRSQMPEVYLPAVDLFVVRDTATGPVKAFAGICAGNLEMLFVHPDHMGEGLGTLLLDYVTANHGVTKVDVNEQNIRAVGFYLSKGFRIVSRDVLDSAGRPYPILHLEL